MSEVPKNPQREKEERRVATEADKRKEEREVSLLALLKEQTNKANNDRGNETSHEKVERLSWRRQSAISILQLREYRRLNCLTLLAVVFAFVSAIGLIVSISRTRSQARIDQRAWVAPTDEKFLKTSAGDPYVAVNFMNTGKTFALKSSAWIDHKFSLKEIPDFDDQTKTTNSGTYAPNGSGSISFAEHPMNAQIIPLIQNGSVLYVYGTIWYEDVFSAEQHWTQFCYALGKDLVTFAPCEGGKHTKTDDKQE